MKNPHAIIPLIFALIAAAIPCGRSAALELADHALVAADAAEPPLELLQRHGLDQRHLRAFLMLNDEPSAWQPLPTDRRYRLPALVTPYDGVSIRTSLSLPMAAAVKVRDYNARLRAAGLKPAVTDDREIPAPTTTPGPGRPGPVGAGHAPSVRPEQRPCHRQRRPQRPGAGR